MKQPTTSLLFFPLCAKKMTRLLDPIKRKSIYSIVHLRMRRIVIRLGVRRARSAQGLAADV
jgi:hypothetical protein